MLLQAHRFYVHTAETDLEDGYNLALLEAMGTGMPVITTRSPTSPVVDEESGFISDDVNYLRWGAQQLLTDRKLAARMGEAGRRAVLERFSVTKFLGHWHEAIREAQIRQQRVARQSRTLAH